MVKRVLEDRHTVVEVAKEMGVSRRTVYKWVQRFCEGNETLAGGNGLTGHDETSENLSATFQLTSPPTSAGPPLCT